MSKTLQAVRGMNDILPEEIGTWHLLENTLKRVSESYGYSEVRLPIVENTALFKRSIGEVTDIVEKEMYTFDDRNGDSLTLRPEGTAVCVRAALEHGLLHNQIQRLWYQGPMFRHERPQKGRYRQFYQFGIEAFGIETPDLDAELILMSARYLATLGLLPHVTLQINSLGSAEARQSYRSLLVNYFEQHIDTLDEDSRRRLHTNPMRILDSKNPELANCIAGAPKLIDYLDEESAKHFKQLCEFLDGNSIQYTINPRIVRGLDYYNRTVFEWVTDHLGAQGTVIAGGRYDSLVEQLGSKKAVPAAGFAVGIERMVLLMTEVAKPELPASVDAYFIKDGDAANQQGLIIAEQLRTELPELRLLNHCGGGSFKSQFKKADKSGAHIALILGEDEMQNSTVSIKFLRENREQQNVVQADLTNHLQHLLEEWRTV